MKKEILVLAFAHLLGLNLYLAPLSSGNMASALLTMTNPLTTVATANRSSGMALLQNSVIEQSSVEKKSAVNNQAVPRQNQEGPVANVETFGADRTGASGITPAVIGAINALPASGGTIYFPSGKYLVSSSIPYNLKSNIRFEMAPGAKLTTTVPGLAFFNSSGTNVVENISWDGMMIDADAPTTAYLTGITLSTDFLRGSARISNCHFIGRNLIGISSANSVAGLAVENSWFHSRGNGTMRGIDILNGGSRNITIRGNRFEYVEAGITIGGVPKDTQGYNLAQNINISGNYFDQGWWSLVEDYSGSGDTVRYTATTITDLNAGRGSGFSGITTGAVVRALTQLATGSGAYAQNIIIGSGFVAAGIKRGHIVHAGSAFALVADVESDKQIRVEQWLSNTTRLPVNVPAAGTTYSIFEPRIGIISNSSAVTLTIPRWITLGTGATAATPSVGTRYEVSKHLPVQMLQISSQLSNVIDNQLRRGMGDQLTLGGNDNNVIGNLIEDGQDMGITVDSGSKNNIIGNIIRRQGSNNILIWRSTGNIVMGNSLSDAGLIVPSATTVANVMVDRSLDNQVTNNFLEQVSSAHKRAYAVIVSSSEAAHPAQSNTVSYNTVSGHPVAAQFLATGNQTSGTRFILTSGTAIFGSGATSTTIHEIMSDGRLKITKAALEGNYYQNQTGLWLTRTGDDSTGIALGDATSYSFIQSYSKPLRLNPAGSNIELGPAASPAVVDGATGGLKPAAKTFAKLGTPPDGVVFWCSDCLVVTPCRGGGSGAWAFRGQGTWKCPF